MESEEKKISETIREYAIITAGLFLIAAGVYYFKIPNHFTTGGTSGLSIILSKFLPISTTNLVSGLNIVILIIGFIFLGKDCGIKNIYGSVVFAAAMKFLDVVAPITEPFTNEPLLELIFAVAVPAVGSAVIFRYGAGSGGTDIIALILKKYTSLDIGKALLCSDALIAGSSFFVFGPQTGLFSVLGLMAKAVAVDSVTESINITKCFTIITERPDEIAEFIHGELNRGVTKYGCIGTYDEKEKWVLISVMRRPEAKRLQDRLKKIDPQAFVIITTSSNIIGKGFRNHM